jgi:hypothetical protein
MANSVSRTLQRIKDDVRRYLPDEVVYAACRNANHVWRTRLIDPVATLHLFILQVLCFNTSITGVLRLAKSSVSAAAYCKARMRLPLAAVQQLLRSSATAMREQADATKQLLWFGLRTLLVDGSSTIAPDTPELQKAFGQHKSQKPGCGFPMPKILGIFDAATGLIIEALAFPVCAHEMGKVSQLHPLLRANDLLVADRGFCSYVHLALLQARNVYALFRMHQKQVVNFRPHRKANKRKGKDNGRPTSKWIKRLGKHDQLVDWAKPKGRGPKWMTPEAYAAMPETLRVRELRYELAKKGQRTHSVTIATTLLDPVLYPKEEIARLYGVRWQVETHFGELKTTLKMRRIRCETEDGVRKELAVYCLVYNLVHSVMLAAAQRQGVSPDRISFIDTVRWLLSAEPGEPLPELLVNPSRPDRHQLRVVKDRQDSYQCMTKPRHEMKKTLKTSRKSR